MANDVIFCRTLSEAFAWVDMAFPERMRAAGRFTRFSTNGHADDNAGWCIQFPDGLGAAFGCHRAGTSFSWQMREAGRVPPTKEEYEAARASHKRARIQAEHEREGAYCRAADEALRIFSAAVPISRENSYVRQKGIEPYMARQGVNGSAIVPVYGPDGALQSLQFIKPGGGKQFLKNGRMKGGRLVIGMLENGQTIVLTEGWATGCSSFQARGLPVVIAFSGSNMPEVAAELRRSFPDSPLLIAGDLDANGRGLEYAQAAQIAGAPATVVLPSFRDGRPSGDFNDLHQAEGLSAVRNQLDAATAPSTAPMVFAAPVLPSCDVRDGTNDTRPLTELGNAARLYDVHGERLRYVYDTAAWLVWNDGAWRWDIGGAEVRFLAAQLPAVIYAEGARHLAHGEAFSRWARISQQLRTITSTVTLLADYPQLRIPLHHIDSDPFLVGFDHARQVIDLKTGQARLARQDDYVTKSLNISEIGDSQSAVRWLRFLDQVFESDQELIDWLRRWCGYMLTGSTAEQFFVFAFGLGANGKSIFAETLKYVMGDYARAIAPETLCDSRRQAGTATPDLADLIGARLALSSETEEGAALAETLIKSLVSGDSMSARRLYGSPVQFKPAFKLLMLGNHKPIIRGSDHGMWRRVRLVPFNRTFAPEERDPQLAEKLKAEAPHILAWMVQGCTEWIKYGLGDTPQAICCATEEYRQDQDIIGEWIAECCIQSPRCETSASDLYDSYRQWCERNGQRPSSSRVLGRRLSERGLAVRQSNGRRLWFGIGLQSDERSRDYAKAKWGT